MSVARLLLFGLLVGGCTQFPEVDAAEGEAVRDARYPSLLPLQNLVKVPEAKATPEARDAFISEADSLTARAQWATEGPVVDPSDFPTPRDASGLSPSSRAEIDAVSTRLAALRQRARGLSDGAVIDERTRARMRRGIDRTPY